MILSLHSLVFLCQNNGIIRI
jgi:hypothetical protein